MHIVHACPDSCSDSYSCKWSSPPIRLRSGQTVWLTSDRPNDSSYVIPPPEKKYYFPHLASNLQKAMRRKLDTVCVSTTYQMLQQDVVKTLRRLPIILLEDVWPHPDLFFVVWCMAAVTKGWRLRKSDVDKLLRIVWEAAHQPKGPHYSKEDKSLSVDASSPPLLQAMALRQNYGGMRGDQRMLASLYGIWEAKLGGGYCLAEDWGEGGSYVHELFRDEYRLPEAIDFHNSSIANALAKEYGLSVDVVKKDLWDNRSSINFRGEVIRHVETMDPKRVDQLAMDIWSMPPIKKKKVETPSILEFIK